MSLERPPLADLFQRSEEALQGGQQLCARAHTFTQNTANTAISVLSLDAQVRWLSDAVIEQLKLALLVARHLEEKQDHLNKEVQVWDTERAVVTDSLDTILDSLGNQYVPPSFHQTSADSSLFGSQNSPSPPASPVLNGHSLPAVPQSPHRLNGGSPSTSPLRNGHAAYAAFISPEQSPSATLRGVPFHGVNNSSKDKRKEKSRQVYPKETVLDRKRWKTLRDFVDDRAIEDILENIENERIALDKTLTESLLLSETLRTNIDSIHASLPGTLPLELRLTSSSAPVPSTPATPTPSSNQERVKAIVEAQEKVSASMAAQLESLANHYSEMSEALDDTEVTFEDEDIQAMVRDTEELPRILQELEGSVRSVESYHTQLAEMQEATSMELQQMHAVLDDLEFLGNIMSDMLKVQQDLEIRAEDQLISLGDHLHTVSELHGRYVAYQVAFAKLVLELDRRVQYRDAAENLVREMSERLQSMCEEETHLRDRFNAEHGAFLPEDLCLCVGNPPTRWEVMPWEGESRELLPDIDTELLTQARDRVGYSESRPEVDSI